jgi:hypothetical protein
MDSGASITLSKRFLGDLHRKVWPIAMFTQMEHHNLSDRPWSGLVQDRLQ